MSDVPFDGGSFPFFRSYHDVRLPRSLVGPKVTDDVQARYAFEDFKKCLAADPNWGKWFTRYQIVAIQHAILTNGPRIQGFCWHHHQDYGVMQLVVESDHKVSHWGGRFTTGGRPR
jgi:hypothetical protein